MSSIFCAHLWFWVVLKHFFLLSCSWTTQRGSVSSWSCDHGGKVSQNAFILTLKVALILWYLLVLECTRFFCRVFDVTMVLEQEVVNAVADKRCYSGADSNVSKKKLAMSNGNNSHRENLDREPASPGEQVKTQLSSFYDQVAPCFQTPKPCFLHERRGLQNIYPFNDQPLAFLLNTL